MWSDKTLGKQGRSRGKGRDARSEASVDAPPVEETQVGEAGAEQVQPQDAQPQEEAVEGEAQAGEAPESAAEEALTDDLAVDLSEGIQSELQEMEELHDRHLRLVAEFENFRKRTRREQAELRVAAQAEFAKRLLPTLDDLARVAEIPRESTTVEALEAGVELILRNLTKELSEAGLRRIEAAGERFDPTLHEGILVSDVDDLDLDQTVGRVLVEGYQLGGRLVRPAQVEVCRYSERKSTEAESVGPGEESGDG